LEIDFVKIECSGALIYAYTTGRFLFIQKSSGKHRGTWGLVGGTMMQAESAWQGLRREIVEEIGSLPAILKTIPLETFVSADSVFRFHTYLCFVPAEFVPVLSSEHSAWAWASIADAPRPLHQGLKSSLNNEIIRSKLAVVLSSVVLSSVVSPSVGYNVVSDITVAAANAPMAVA
jgi:8-oxo-dGTP pyrophosphatase MutT (NUDIX family)